MSFLKSLLGKSVKTEIDTKDDYSTKIQQEYDIYFTKYLTEAGKYAYGGLCAVTLRDLFYSDHPEFCKKALKTILNQLAMSNQVELNIQDLLIEGTIFDPIPFASVLKKEQIIIEKQPLVIIQDLISLALIEAEYDSRWRYFIRTVAKYLMITADLEDYEMLVADFVIRGSKEVSKDENLKIRSNEKKEKIKRFALITLVSVCGGAAVGITGGMAAPFLVEGLAAVIGTSTFGAAAVTALSTTTGTLAIASLFGTAGVSLTAYKMKKRVGELNEFAFGQLFQDGVVNNNEIPLIDRPYLTATIAISGWIHDSSENNFSLPWRRLNLSKEQYFLKYESEQLLELGKAFNCSIFETGFKAVLEPFKYLPLGVLKGVTLTSVLLSLSSIIDTPWSVGCSKAALAGKQLAQVLLARTHGRRPVTLIGYSLGARVIYYCLLELLEREDSEGIIEDVYIIGGPCPADTEKWQNFMKIVSGTLTNAYSSSDLMLKFLYRVLSLPKGGVAGLNPINVEHKRLRNIDISHIISGHREYGEKLNIVLKELNVRLKAEEEHLRLLPGYEALPSTSKNKIC